MSEKLKFSLLICFFFLLMIISICLIIKLWNRYSTFSNGTYKNAGQKLIFEIFFSKEEPNGIFNICGRIKKIYTKE